jgi:hypothetical protein
MQKNIPKKRKINQLNWGILSNLPA